MAKPALKPATYDDLRKVPPHMVAEIVEGELFASPRPRSRHAHAAGTLFRRIANRFQDGDDGPGGWWIVIEPELHLDRDVLVPDIAGWRTERMPEFPDVAAFELAPDWVCEVVSPSTAVVDRVYKVPVYARHRVAHGWIIDPVLKSLELYRLSGEHWATIETFIGDEVVRVEPFESLDLRLSNLWL